MPKATVQPRIHVTETSFKQYLSITNTRCWANFSGPRALRLYDIRAFAKIHAQRNRRFPAFSPRPAHCDSLTFVKRVKIARGTLRGRYMFCRDNLACAQKNKSLAAHRSADPPRGQSEGSQTPPKSAYTTLKDSGTTKFDINNQLATSCRQSSNRNLCRRGTRMRIAFLFLSQMRARLSTMRLFCFCASGSLSRPPSAGLAAFAPLSPFTHFAIDGTSITVKRRIRELTLTFLGNNRKTRSKLTVRNRSKIGQLAQNADQNASPPPPPRPSLRPGHCA